MVAALAILGTVAAMAYWAPLASGSSVSGASFSGGSGTVTVNGTVYAKNGGALTLNVTTSSDTQCVDLSGAFTGHQQSTTAKSSWSFSPLTAGAGDGTQTVTVSASPGFNGQNKCNGNTGTATASYVLDNTGPVVTAALAPAANGAGWNNSNTTVTWSATDQVGINSGPTPSSVTENQNGIYNLSSTATDKLGNSATGSVQVQLDKAAPSIVASRTPAANGFGWNNTDVAVSFTCTDNPSTNASGINQADCAGTTVSTEAANQSVSRTISDVAGNTASSTMSGISIDTTAPTLSGAATNSSNAAGWYKNNVTIHWTASDALSGLDPATVPGDSTISSEGSNLTASASASDKAGNVRSATSAPVKIDKTPPVTGITGASNDWTNGNVTLTLSPTDALSGVAATSYSVDGGTTQSGTSVTLSTEGQHTVTYFSTDNAGNGETAKTVLVKIDKTAPTISHVFVSPTGYTDGGWTNSNVTVHFTCTDTGSGVASCTSDQVVGTQGAGQQVTGTGTDNAGNSATNTATVSIDKTPPTIVAAADRDANGNGWYSDTVTVSYNCADQANLSGIKSCPASKVLGEGKNQTASGIAQDIAGNTTTTSLTGINVDKTAPTLTGAPTSLPNANGWYDNSVVIAWTCSDVLSGIDGACPANSTVTGEGGNLSASASVSDKAGNVATALVSGLKIDVTTPETLATVSAPLVSGWYADHAHVTLTGNDNLSGVDQTYYNVDGGATKTYAGAFDFSTPGIHTITFWSVDRAGNAEDATAGGHTITVKIDNLKPNIAGNATPAPDAAGWNNSPVTVAFSCSDGESGVATCAGGTTLTADGANQFVTGTATDNGGNSDTATVGPINVDTTAPSVSGSATTAPNSNGWYNGDVTVHWTANDATSGVDESTLSDDTVMTDEGGDLTAGPATVKDVAGNTGSGSLQHVKIDRTAPSIAGQPTTSPNDNGWYDAPVTVDWACSDALSGIVAGTCPADSTISGEGASLSATASVSDRADNTGHATVAGIKIDQTAPSTEISAPSGWQNASATVSFSATDNLSGVDVTHYTVNGGPVQTGNTETFSTEGSYDLDVWSVDKAGNVEAHKSAAVLIDKTAPTISHTQSPAANADGWNNADVTITFTCNDTGGSDIAFCTAPITEKHEGKDQPEPGTGTDNAGNTAIDPATVSIDKSDPTIVGAPDREANDNGWYDRDVTVTFTCDDQAVLSGVKSCAAPVTRGQGVDQSATGTATDAAGNSASATVSHINVDNTAPALAGAATADPNGDGWYNGDVTVKWTCSDDLSGIDGTCPANSTVTGEGANLSADASVSDHAGNSTSATVSGIQIDRTAPTTTASLPTPDSDNGWYKSGPKVSLNAIDTLSGVKTTWYRVDNGTAQQYTGPFTEGLEGEHMVTFWSSDEAGNLENASGAGNSVTIRLDTTNPNISGSRQPAANSAGWNNEPVQVSFSCSDIGSGIDTCTAPVTLASQGANQSASGTAIDKVGNSNSATVGGINIDLNPPSLTGAATTAPNMARWYRGDVTVHWTCSDDLSGVVGSCPADSTVAGEGEDLSASAAISDKAGNQTAATVDKLKIDRTGPVTSVSAPSDWQKTGVNLDVEATDNLSGVNATYYTVNGGATQTGNKISLTADGTYTLTFWSVDNAGNTGAHGSASVKIDQAAPSITHTIEPDPNDDLWNNTDATVHFLCDDPLSGVKSCTSDQVVTTEAADQKVAGTAVDNAGNSSTDTATVNLDKTKPTITGKADRPANDNGWYDANLTVNFTCGDGLSGIKNCAADQTLSEGGAQAVTGTAYDKAGNSQTATVSGINVDETAPSLYGTVTSLPNGNDWYNGNVTVRWTCSDALSGIAGSCPADSTVSGEGDNLTASATVTDKAGNQTTRTVEGIHIDRTAPVTAASAPDPTFPSGWYGGPVTVTLAASDNLSGLDTTYYSVDGGPAVTYGAPFQIGKGTHTVNFWSKDAAGNLEDKASARHSLTLKVDDVPPTITGAAASAPNANGWYSGPVTVHFACSDAETSIESCPGDKTLSAEGGNQYVSGTARDVAGNTATANVGPINIDKSAPVIDPYTGPTSFTVGQIVTPPTCSATDALSGMDGCTVSKSGSGFSSPNGAGDYVYTSTAKDKAGNSATQSVTLHVGYKFSGFLQPVTNTAHDLGTASSFKAGSTIPFKFQLKNAAGAVVQGAYMPAWLQPIDGGGTSTTATAQTSTAPATVGGSFKWDPTAQQYVFTWQTPKSGTGHYYRVGVQLDSGDTYTTLVILQ